MPLSLTCIRCGDVFEKPPGDAGLGICDGCYYFHSPDVDPKRLKRKIKKTSRKQEKKVMDGIGGRIQPASGAMASHKSDGRLRDRIRMEAKFTYADSYRVTLKDLNKLRSECQGTERPAFVIDFTDKPTGRVNDRWVLIPHKDWEDFVNSKE